MSKRSAPGVDLMAVEVQVGEHGQIRLPPELLAQAGIAANSNLVAVRRAGALLLFPATTPLARIDAARKLRRMGPLASEAQQEKAHKVREAAESGVADPAAAASTEAAGAAQAKEAPAVAAESTAAELPGASTAAGKAEGEKRGGFARFARRETPRLLAEQPHLRNEFKTLGKLLGDRWEALSKEERLALAQSPVGGETASSGR